MAHTGYCWIGVGFALDTSGNYRRDFYCPAFICTDIL